MEINKKRCVRGIREETWQPTTIYEQVAYEGRVLTHANG